MNSNKSDKKKAHRRDVSGNNPSAFDDKRENRDAVRLNRYIANSGICTRREADDLIIQGLITVNKKVETSLGIKVGIDDVVEFDGKVINPEIKRYLLLNKPKDFVANRNEEENRGKDANILINKACNESLKPVSFMDGRTTGLLLFTNDNGLVDKISRTETKIKKIYHVFLNKPLDKKDMNYLLKGLKIGAKLLKVNAISYTGMDNKTEVGIELHSGDNMVIDELFNTLDYEVIKMDCVSYGGLTKKNLTRGRWRFLNQKEINGLKMI